MTSHYGGRERVHPYFIGFGSITSRVIVKEPSLQNLRKSNRDIIIPERNKKLLYIDFSQFEAGILAHISKDSKLIKLYNEEDIYSDIVKNALGKTPNEENRSNAKILFYRYLYGDDFSSDKTIDKKKINTYFNKFTTLNTFKLNLIKESKQNLIVKSIDGNHRIINEENDNIWILSHHIQSIASYIFKKALIDVYNFYVGARLLIPLHDGALYEVYVWDYNDAEKKIKELFTKNFKKVCDSLEAKAEIKDFHSHVDLL